MKIIAAAGLIALCSTLSACWFYSKPEDATTGCRTTTYGVAIASTSNTSCPPADAAPAAPAPVPALPSPAL